MARLYATPGAVASASLPPATTTASRIATGAPARRRSGAAPSVAGRARGRAGGREPQPAGTALDPGERAAPIPASTGRIGRPAAPHPRSRASAMRWAMRLWSEKSSMKPGAAPCAKEVSALKVARLRS